MRDKLEGAIFRPNQEITTEHQFEESDDPQRSVEVYTVIGKNDFLDDDDCPRLGDVFADNHMIMAEDRPEAMAKVVQIDGNAPRYFIKRGSRGDLYNPVGIFTENTLHAKRHFSDEKEWTFSPVNKKTFDFYIRFLRSKNNSYLLHAERS